MLQTGLKGTCEHLVEAGDSARNRASGTLEVLATPALVELMERTAWESIADELEAGQTTVGTFMGIEHTAPTPIGMMVRCESELVAIDRRALTFALQAFDETGAIATAEHKRFIVDADRFQDKADAKSHETR